MKKPVMVFKNTGLCSWVSNSQENVYIYFSNNPLNKGIIAPPAVAECIYIFPEIRHTDMVYGITLNGPTCGKTYHS